MSRPKDFLAWATEMFGPIACDDLERTRRFVEEALELAHAMSLPLRDVDAISARVYSRPPGNIPQEIGQAQACLETLAENLNLSADREAYLEFGRVRSIPKSEWQRRHAAKVAIGIAGADVGVCDTCRSNPPNHWVGATKLCCGCYVRAGHPPADWHIECMRVSGASSNG